MKLLIKATPVDAHDPEMITVEVDIDIASILANLDDADKGRVIFALLAKIYHEYENNPVANVDWVKEIRSNRLEAFREVIKGIKILYRGRWRWDRCGLSKEDAELFGWDIIG